MSRVGEARHPRRLAQLALLGAIALVAALEQLRFVRRFAQELTNEDQTLLWAAARDWGHLRFRQPSFWGQTYGTTFEAVPTALAHGLGVPAHTALPIVLALMGLSAWWALALAAWYRGHPVLAVAAAAAPILLVTDASLLVDVYGAGAGRFLAALALALAVAKPVRSLAVAVFVGLGGFAIVFEASAAIVVVPAGIWFVLRDRRVEWRRLLPWAAAGAGPVAGWLLFETLFFRAHPDYDLHPPPPLDPSLDTLRRTLGHPGEYFRLAAPELWRWWPLPVALGIVALVLLAATRRVELWLPAAAATLGVLGVLSTPRALDGFSTVFFPKARVLMLLPVLLWFLWFLVAESARFHGRGRGLVAGVAVMLLVAVTVPVRAAGLDHRLAGLRSTALASSRLPVLTVNYLRAQCTRIRDVAHETGTGLAVLYEAGVDRNPAYGCASLVDRAPDTLFPSYERRTWRLYEERDRVRTSMIVWRVDDGFCGRVARRAGITGCQLTDDRGGTPGYALVRFRPQSALDVLREIGIEVRPFGRGCHPRRPSTCPRP